MKELNGGTEKSLVKRPAPYALGLGDYWSAFLSAEVELEWGKLVLLLR